AAIPAAVIGKIEDGSSRILFSKAGVIDICEPGSDELYKVIKA
ncbi:MAG: AIR synthase, partial [Clostridiales bacterium]|nr:AIR synthase [Clostridiales bacterium]